MSEKVDEVVSEAEPEPENVVMAVAVEGGVDATARGGPFTPSNVEMTEAVVHDSVCHYYLRYATADSSTVYVVRRYSEFESLRGTIAAAAATVEVSAPFPEKYYFGAWQSHVVEERKVGLADWINALLALDSVPQELADFLAPEETDETVTKDMIERLGDPLVAQKGCSPDQFVQYKVPHGADGKHFACNHDSCMTIEVAEQGAAARPPTTLTALFDMCKDLGGGAKAMWWEEPQADGSYQPREWTWAQYHEDTMAAACSFIALGVEQFGSVSIIGFNSPQWSMACMGAIACGAKAAGIYATNEPDACQYIVEHSESSVVIVENDAQLKKFTDSGILARLPKVKALVQYTGATINEERISNAGEGVQVLTWSQFLNVGAEDATLNAKLDERKAAQKPGHCCSLIYTSGTTGPPKAVMISHDNACWTSMAFLVNEPGISEPGGEHDIVSYLPLSHIAAQALDIFFPIVGTSGLGEGAAKSFKICVTFARPDALRGSLKDTLNIAKPTVFFAVPRVWEKFSEAIQAKAKQGQDTVMGQVTMSLGSWAKGKVSEAYKESQAGGATGWTPVGFSVASKLVAKAQQALGLERCKWMYTGAAPITKETLEYFGSIGIKILELYGMSENTGPMTVSNDRMNGSRVGSAGLPLGGCELKVEHTPGRDKIGEGELCFRGRHVMMGYLKDPVKTAETIDPEGFLHSGDVGSIDRYGLLSITGRIKELIITAGGENIAPVPCEDSIKLHANGVISNVVMIGDKRKFNTCLITLKQKPDPDANSGQGGFFEELDGAAAALSPTCTTAAQAAVDSAWITHLRAAISTYNSQDAVSNAAKVQKFTILPHDFVFAGEDAELTATLKLKRPVVVRKYASYIEAMYDGTGGVNVKG